ncbi:imidazole glycerol phosphate synthase subunit HisF [Candidatus Woesearchaeota archaeon]|nr:imidazole glycerol phosphate synthase subunit HisF [Candidatus Woesearchaeota archaeon]
MLKTRVIPCLLFKDRTIVKSVKFDNYRMIGDPTTVARVFNVRNSDELMFLDIMASQRNDEPNFKVIQDIAKECFMPLTIGGGIKNFEHARKLFEIGADKICINTALITNPELITEISSKYGAQAVIVSIDAIKQDDKYLAVIRSGKEITNYDPVKLAKKAQELGAGEIMITSIDRDGTMEGYDLELIKLISKSVSIPVIASGGCGKTKDFVDAIKNGADAVSGASIFHFVGESMITVKKYMSDNGINVRIL